MWVGVLFSTDDADTGKREETEDMRQPEIDRLTKALQDSLDKVAAWKWEDQEVARRLDHAVQLGALANFDSEHDLEHHIRRVLRQEQQDRETRGDFCDWWAAEEDSLAARESYDDVTRGTFDAEDRVRS